ncbi:hypothetical protein GCM10022420_052750 [Streptomyces iranensis]
MVSGGAGLPDGGASDTDMADHFLFNALGAGFRKSGAERAGPRPEQKSTPTKKVQRLNFSIRSTYG